MTDVDECERWPRQASKINATAPGDLAERCSRSEIDFTHVSTDYVFDGDNPTRYAEDDEPNPLQVYGRSKLAGERAAMDAHEETLILRLSFVYGLDRSGTSPELRGFPAWVRSRYRSGYEVPLFTDQHVTPSRSGAAAATLLELHQTGATGRYHVAARTCVTPHEFGRRLIDEARIDGVRVTSTSSDAVSRLAERPLNTCLCVKHITERLRRPQPTLSADIRAIDDYL